MRPTSIKNCASNQEGARGMTIAIEAKQLLDVAPQSFSFYLATTPYSTGGKARVICALIDICYNPANKREVLMKSLAVLLLILLLPNIGSAQKTTTSYEVGSALVERCKDYPVTDKTSMPQELLKVEVKIGFCEGYIEAHAEALTYEGKACIEADIDPAQLIAVVNKYLTDHPELWNRGASWLVRNALIQAFPCSK
jgi:hypothetical protein